MTACQHCDDPNGLLIPSKQSVLCVDCIESVYFWPVIEERVHLCEACGAVVFDGEDACYELARVSCQACFLARLEA